ncbi:MULTISPECIES: hypothetical protein [unclassified Halomonas]|uniref:hypothetical protein n=1 Tax=unclassified Halomonas TaxID=2609666 RepID=UPI0020769FFF|nr:MULTISPECIES: hypothetical protein [unclassified Halomonas]
MGSLYAVPDQNAVRYPQHLAERQPTPKELFEEGDYAMTDSLMRWVRQEHNECHMIDLFCERNAAFQRDEIIERWDREVRAGKWA